MKNILFFLAYLIFNLGLLKLLVKGVYIPVYVQFSWLKKYQVKTIIDIGGHQGNVSKALQYLFPKARIFIFEPIPKNVSFIKQKINLNFTMVEQLAISDKNSNQIFHIYENTEVSSLLPVRKGQKHLNAFGGKSINVQTTTLDKYFKNKRLNKIVFMKIDTQGSEAKILKGGSKTLRMVDILHIEMTFEEIYEGEAVFSEIYDFLTKHNFIYKGEVQESYFYPTFLPRRQVNAIFVKKNIKNLYE